MKFTKTMTITISEEDIKEVLFEYDSLLGDELSNFSSEICDFVLKNPKPEDDTTEEFDKWIQQYIEIQDKHEKIILNAILKQFMNYKE